MGWVMDILCYSFVLSQVLTSAYGMTCFNCNSTLEYDACAEGSSAIPKKSCLLEEVCATYQYDVYLNDKIIGVGTSRGCEKNKDYCGVIEDMINVLVKPAAVKERKCYICEKDLCNTSPNIKVSYIVLVSILLINNIIIHFDLF